jgi:cytosine/adenosine deaminase-related metal-dependent hydrolase
MSADVISLNSGDLWHEMRFGLACARADAADATNFAGAMPDTLGATTRDAISWGTINGANALGLGDRVGSLTPGKRADLILVGGPSIEQHPHVNPYATLVFQTNADDVRTVLVDGRIVKRDGVLTITDRAALTAEVDAASDRILGRVRDAGRALPGTPPGAWAAIEPMACEFQAQAARAAKQALASPQSLVRA